MDTLKIVTVGDYGVIQLPEPIRNMFSDYVTMLIDGADILLRMPTLDDKWK